MMLGLRTRWNSVVRQPLRIRRSSGQIALAAAALYGRHLDVFLLIGLLPMPLAAGIALGEPDELGRDRLGVEQFGGAGWMVDDGHRLPG